MDDTRRAILDHAVALVAENGVRGVSFREVARRAGVSHQAPYHHFGNLRGILEEVAREGFDALTAAMQKAARPHEDPVDALTAMGVAYVTFASKHAGHFRVMFQRSLVDIHDQEIEEAAGTFQTLMTCATEVSASGAAAVMDAETLAHLCWSTAHGLATLIVEGSLQKKTRREVQAEAKRVVEGLTALIRGSG